MVVEGTNSFTINPFKTVAGHAEPLAAIHVSGHAAVQGLVRDHVPIPVTPVQILVILARTPAHAQLICTR